LRPIEAMKIANTGTQRLVPCKGTSARMRATMSASSARSASRLNRVRSAARTRARESLQPLDSL
jgi:hypothetical protein